MKNKIKFFVENILVWCLGKLNIGRLKKLTVSDNRVVIGIEKFVPDDGEWHQFAATAEFWMKKQPGKNGEESKYDEVAIYLDGTLKSRYRLDNAVEETV